jgi:hypothetical protein
LICRDGRAVRAIGDAIGCGDGPAIADPYVCSSACPSADRCTLACTDDRCRLACSAASMSCSATCFDTARDSCRAAGLDRFGLCESVAIAARQLDDAQQSLATTAAAVRAQFDARDALAAAIAAGESCEHACAAGDTRCYASCATTARERCERDITIAHWCDGLRAQETALRGALQR